MGTKSGKERLAALVSGVALSAATLLPAGSVRATHGTGLTRSGTDRVTVWTVSYTSGATCIGVIDADITFTTGDERTDAFDGALELKLDNGTATNIFNLTAEAAVVDYGATTDATVSGSCAASVGGQDLTAEVQLVFDRDQGMVTGTAVVTNASDAPFTGKVQFRTNFGSDSDTVVELTSSGDAVLSPDDRWIITSEDSDFGGGSDPVIRSFTNTPGAVLGADTDLDGNDDLYWELAVSDLAIGESVTLTAGHYLDRDVESATPPTAAPSVPVPVMTNPGLLALAGALGLFGALGLSRRKKKPAATL